jgi:nucleoside-diphosphate-sugar epimerase
VFGPGDREVFRLIQLIAVSHLNFLPGFRQPLFPFIAVQDLIDCIVKAVHAGSVLRPISSDARPGGEALGDGIYYAADPQFCSFRQFGHWIARGLGHRWHKPIPLPLFAVRGVARINALLSSDKRPSTLTPDKIREAAVLGWECDVAKTMRELQWAPAASLPQRLCETIAWYRQHGWLR